jgi:single-stranded-DNA-specific exonuclease
VSVRLIGRGETPWSDPITTELRSANRGLLIVTDLGVRAEQVLAGVPTILIDHQVSPGTPEGAIVISVVREEPTPSSSLLACSCMQALVDIDDLVWLVGLGIIGDYGEKAPFAELSETRRRHGSKALRRPPCSSMQHGAQASAMRGLPSHC